MSKPVEPTLNGLYPASSPVHSLRNVQLSRCVKRSGNCPENSKRVSRRGDDVSILPPACSTQAPILA